MQHAPQVPHSVLLWPHSKVQGPRSQRGGRVPGTGLAMGLLPLEGSLCKERWLLFSTPNENAATVCDYKLYQNICKPWNQRGVDNVQLPLSVNNQTHRLLRLTSICWEISDPAHKQEDGRFYLWPLMVIQAKR